jgi:NDP-sugar pyrophosphorylase family protein
VKTKLQIVIPLSGGNQFFDSEEYVYPKPLVEIDSKPMIQWVVENYNNIIDESVKVIFITKEPECTKFNIDYTLKILCPQSKVIKLQNTTKGAVCTVLMAIDELDLNAPLIIANGDQYIEEDISAVIDYFKKHKSDAGVLCFNSVHPKWSYIRPGENNTVLETAEKKPISSKAIAGLYYFAKASHFFEAASKGILNDQSLDGIFFVSLVMNELILTGKKINYYEIDADKYHSFYSPKKIEEFKLTNTNANS